MLLYYKHHLYYSFAGVYVISDDLPTVFPIGSQVNVAFERVQFSSHFGLYSLSQKRLLLPDNIQHNLETRSVQISFPQAGPSLSGDYILCGLPNIPNSRRRKSTSMGSSHCGRRTSINITGTKLLLYISVDAIVVLQCLH